MSDGFHFDSLLHRYTLNGVVIPGITKTLDLTGFIEKGWFKPTDADRGRAVHAACQYLIEGDLHWPDVDPEILPRVKEFQRFLDNVRPKLILAEEALYSGLYNFGGMPDLLLEVHGEIWLPDIKSGRSGLAAKLQTAAQKILVEERKGIKVDRRFALELLDGQRAKMIEHKDRGDGVMFLNAVAMVHRRINEGELKI